MHKPTSKFLGFRFLGFSSHNETIILTINDSDVEGNNIWVTTNPDIAERAVKNHPEWYDSDFENPMNPFNSDELEVWKIMEVERK